jgi:hypothetical protein
VGELSLLSPRSWCQCGGEERMVVMVKWNNGEQQWMPWSWRSLLPPSRHLWLTEAERRAVSQRAVDHLQRLLRPLM